VIKTNRRAAVSYSGWALDLTIELDRVCPGLLAASFRFASQRRQAFFLVLALAEILGINEVADQPPSRGGHDGDHWHGTEHHSR
jgi:hypothetical protein